MDKLDKAKVRDARIKGDRKQYKRETGKSYTRTAKVKVSRPKMDPRDY